jgi:hypothetical protein
MGTGHGSEPGQGLAKSGSCTQRGPTSTLGVLLVPAHYISPLTSIPYREECSILQPAAAERSWLLALSFRLTTVTGGHNGAIVQGSPDYEYVTETVE